MIKSKINLILNFSVLAGCLLLASCSGKGLKLVKTTGLTSSNGYVGVMLSDEKGIVAGEKGLVMTSDDGGKTWQPDKVVAPFVAGLYAVNEKVCYMNGDTFVFMKTTDGGKTKELLPRSRLGVGKGVSMIDENVGWVWGKETLRSGLYEYDDTAKDYIKIPLPEGSSYVESALMFERGKGIFMDTKGRVYKTSDYGKNWETGEVIFKEEGIAPVVKNVLPTNGIWEDESGIHIGYFAKKDGYDNYFVMMTSVDGGKTFEKTFMNMLKKEPKSMIVNFRNEICILNVDTTMDVYKY
ncbi:MAG: hypothetical protein MJ188_10340 [Treponema sp.]|nr:hypothetical protein [Treponema sp.]